MKVTRCNLRDANDFVAVFHRHNRPCVGAIFSLGAIHGSIVVGVAIVGRPIARHLDHGDTCEALRVCTSTDAPKGTCSFLYGAARRAAAALGFKMICTYTLSTESGASLRGAGWQMAAHLPARTGWSCAARERAIGTVDHQEKIRWEVDL